MLLVRRSHTAIAMQPIIGQNPEPLPFPDLRNLGTIARILLGANALFALGALVRASRWGAWPDEWMDVVAIAEPHLLIELTLLVALAPWLGRLPYRVGVGVVLALTVAVGMLADVVLGGLASLPPGSRSRHLALALVVAGTLLFYFHLRAKALSPSVINARLQALQARIRPHFLFNSITAVLSLVRADPRRAETALEDMADLFRVLMSDNRNLVPLADEVNLCRQYLALEHLRLGNRLRVEWHLNGMPGDALVPPLVLQPLLENAVYHGIEPMSAPGVVSINIFAKDGHVHAILRNPYRAEGGRHHAGNKMALGNVRERLALHFDVEAALESQVKGDSYEVHIRMPYHTAARAPATAPAGAGANREGSAARDGGRFARHAGRTERPEASRD
jgi:two-component system sensor histidine kinase AlgZ